MRRRVMMAYGSAVTASIVVILLILFSPSLSPLGAIGDWDGDGYNNATDAFPRDAYEWQDEDDDGVGDNADEFPDDRTESVDSDDDGVGDNADFSDSGNGAISIRLTEFEFIGYETNYYRWRYYPNAWFQIFIDLGDDGSTDSIVESPIFNETRSLSDFFNVTLDIPDSTKKLSFTIVVYDVWSVSSSEVTDYEIIDFSPVEDLKSPEHVMYLPESNEWLMTGEGDGDTPDCNLSYAFETIEVSP